MIAHGIEWFAEYEIVMASAEPSVTWCLRREPFSSAFHSSHSPCIVSLLLADRVEVVISQSKMLPRMLKRREMKSSCLGGRLPGHRNNARREYFSINIADNHHASSRSTSTIPHISASATHTSTRHHRPAARPQPRHPHLPQRQAEPTSVDPGIGCFCEGNGGLG
jgi:hypothetical protein